MINKDNFNDNYMESFSRQLDSEKNRIRDLIDDRHWLSDGAHKEIIFKKVLSQFLPTKYKIASGFIIDIDENGEKVSSKQIDILIYDSKASTYYNSGDLVIIGKKYVKAVIEVKTKLDASKYKKALENIQIAQSIIGLKSVKKDIKGVKRRRARKVKVKRNKVFYGIFAYDKSDTGDVIGEYIVDEKVDEFREMIVTERDMDEIISHKVCINKYSYLNVSVKREKNKVVLKQVQTENSLAYFICALLEKLECKDLNIIRELYDKNIPYDSKIPLKPSHNTTVSDIPI